jgi:hypothetical protein
MSAEGALDMFVIGSKYLVRVAERLSECPRSHIGIAFDQKPFNT